MTPTHRHFDEKPAEFAVSIDDSGTLLNAEWRKDITDTESGIFEAKCHFAPQFADATEVSIRDALVGLFMKCTEADKGDLIDFYQRAQAFAVSLFIG